MTRKGSAIQQNRGETVRRQAAPFWRKLSVCFPIGSLTVERAPCEVGPRQGPPSSGEQTKNRLEPLRESEADAARGRGGSRPSG